MQLTHIYFFSWFNANSVSTRYRGLYFLEELKQSKGISYTFVYPGYKLKELFRFTIAFLEIMLFRKKNSIIIYQKIYTNGIYSKTLKLLLKLSPKNTIYDTDDADYLRYDTKVITHFMKHCSSCHVGSTALKKYTLKYNKNVHVLTSPIITHYQVKSKKSKLFHVGWIGNYGTNEGVIEPFSHKLSLEKLLYPGLLELNFDYKLTILGIKNPKDKVDIELLFKNKRNVSLSIPQNINWLDEISIYNRVKEFDIGVSPMINHEFNIAKSAFKVKQYLSSGVPVLASPVGENLSFIKDGENGYFCKNANEFKIKLEEFYQKTETNYKKIIKNTLSEIDSFNIESYSKQFIESIQEIDLH
ncbi:MAG: hypothetical protein COA97_07085 [Flavobacteriales bacterium]|nr:MAG: hypothetical protein COA97_07085 [Flavobacteriales bacterium]